VEYNSEWKAEHSKILVPGLYLNWYRKNAASTVIHTRKKIKERLLLLSRKESEFKKLLIAIFLKNMSLVFVV
jgi:hypothetical protein